MTVTTAAPGTEAGAASSSSSTSSSSSSSSSNPGAGSARAILNEILNNNPCGEEEVFNPITGMCIDMSELANMADDVIKILCPDGYKWNPSQAVCEEVT